MLPVSRTKSLLVRFSTLVAVLVLMLFTSNTASAWFDQNWPHRKAITIDHTKVTSDLTNFPVLIVVPSDTDLAAKALSNGNDILFTDAADNQLDHEIEYYDGANGNLVAWVRVPLLSASSDTRLYIYYGNAGATNQENPTGVWDTNYVMIQHLEENSGTHEDSTSNNCDGIPQNGLTQDSTGNIDGADSFDGVDDFLDLQTHTALDVFGPDQDFSIFMWVQRDDFTGVDGFFSAGSSSDYGIYFGSLYGDADDLRFFSPGNTVDVQSSTSPLGDTEWHYVGVTADRDATMTLWVDGMSIHSQSIAAFAVEDWNRQDDTYKAGTDRSENGPNNGLMDEIRVSNVVRSPDWISTTYNNASEPIAFYTLGDEEIANAPIVSNESPANGSTGVSPSITSLSFQIADPEMDPMDYEVTTNPDIGSGSDNGVGDGIYTVPVSGLDYGQTYTWYLSVTDGVHTTERTFSFSTELDTPAISNPDPVDSASYVSLNPTLQADILDAQGEAVDWEISLFLDGSWQLMGSGMLPGGDDTVLASTTGVDAYGTTYTWRVRASDSGTGVWSEEIYTFETVRQEINFAAFTDTHIGAEIETGWGMADYADLLAQDIMNNTAPCDFVVHLGDIVMHSTAYVEGEGLPSQYNQYVNNFKAYLLQHINTPFASVAGNHDMVDYYGESHAGYPQNGDDPYNLVRALIDTTEMNSYPYAFMRNNILFIALPETDYHHYTKPTIHEYVQYMVQRYPDNTTIILSHQAIEDTTTHDGTGSSTTYRGKQDRAWWSALFRANPQIKMWIHGHQHVTDWYLSDQSTGLSYPVEEFGHEMAFSHPYSQADWGDYHEEDRVVIYSITPDSISTRTWENNGAGGGWVSGYDHHWTITTTYDDTAQDWYSFPIFLQDGEIQLTDMKVFSPKTTLELIGTQPMELFYDPTMATEGTTWGGENLLGFGDDTYTEATARLPGMTVDGPADLNFPPKYPGSAFQGGSTAYHEDGRTGQPYHYFPVGTTHAAVPGATYDIVIRARSTAGTGQIDVDISVSDWGTQSHYSTLAGSTQQVISHNFGTTYETVTGTYTAPNDINAWFLQGELDFLDTTDYDVSLFSIKRTQDTQTTDDFSLSLNGTWYNHTGSLAQFERAEFTIDPTTLADDEGVIEITSSINGNHFGMARLVYHAPLLMGRNARFKVNSVVGNAYNLTLQQDLSHFSNTFKMFPFSGKYGTLTVSSDDGSATKMSSANGNEWIESDTPTDLTKVTLDIEYGEDAPTISDESPVNTATGIDPNPTLTADILDLQGDAVDWEIRTDASGTWQTIASGTLAEGEGTISTTPTTMDQYDTTYSWSVRAIDASGSGETVEEVYTFTTRPENYPPILNNPTPADGAVNVPPIPILSVEVSDLDGHTMDVIFQTNASGSWETIATYTGVGDGTYTASSTDMNEHATTYSWRVEVNDGSGAVSEEYALTTIAAPGTWWDAAWFYRKEIVIDANRVDDDLMDFPVLIDLTDADLTARALPNGDDISFTDIHGVKLNHEIEAYESATGHLLAWVKVPTLSSSQDTTLYLYFGNGAATSQENVPGTWDENYVMVHHLAEGTGDHYDSTAFDNHGTTINVIDQNAVGQVNGADEFDGSDDYIRVPDATSLQFGEGSLTAEAWIRPQTIPDLTGGARIVNNRGSGAGGNYKGYQFKIKDDAGQWYIGDSGIDDATGSYQDYEGITTYSYNQWHHVVMAYEADNQLVFYVDGAIDGTLAIGTYGDISNSLPTAVGASIAHEGSEAGDNRQFFDGILDEVRLSNTARSAGWVSTSYNNQSDPTAFYALGNLEVESGPPEVSGPVPADGATGIDVDLSTLTFELHDPDGGLMDYAVTTTPDIGSDSATDVSDGTYSANVAGLAYDTSYTWDVRVTDGTDITNESFSFTTRPAPATWWDADWAYRKEIVIDHTRVVDHLVNFPVLITITDGSLLSLVQEDGDDIAFTDYGNAQLAHEIESYNSSTGDLVIWVNVPNLSATEDTILYMYFGNREAGNQQTPASVWDADYVLVQHLGETTGTHRDSTSYGNDGTPYTLASQDAVGQIDGADEFSGITGQVDVGTDTSLDVFGPNQDFSISLWSKRDDLTNLDGMFAAGADGSGGIVLATANDNEDDLRFLSPGNTVDLETNGDVIGDTDWHFISATADRDGNFHFWIDGIPVFTQTIASSAGENWNRISDTYKIGVDRSENHPFDGILDEIRLSRIVRSPGWIRTSYNNQRAPNAFYSITQDPTTPYASPTISLSNPNDGVDVEAPVNFRFTPQTQIPGQSGRAQAELWLNITETYDGEVVFTDNTYAPQRAVIKDGQLIQVEGGDGVCRITIREFPGGTILQESPTFGSGTHSNTSVVIDGDMIYGVCTDGRLQAWNRATDTVAWTILVGPGGSYSVTSNSMEVHNGYIYLQSADFAIHKIRMSDGVEDPVSPLNLDNTGGQALKAHMLVDYDNDRLYALGDSNYYAIDLTTFSIDWTTAIVTNGGRDTRGGPVLVDDANSGQYLTIITTFPQDYTYAIDYNGNIVWTWTEKPIRAHATYNPNTGLIYITDATGYTDAGTGLTLPGTVYALHVNNGTEAWQSHGDGTDRFSRPITASGNYLIFKTDNPSTDDYLYVLDATTGDVLAKIPAGGNKGYWCFPPALSDGYVATGGGYTSQGGNVLDIYHIGTGTPVDYYPLHGNVQHTGYVNGGLTSLGFSTTSWQLAKVNETPIANGVANTIEYDFAGQSLPDTMDWNIKLIQSDNQATWGTPREITVHPIWYNIDWLYRKPVTIGHIHVNEDLTDYPLLLVTVDADLASKAQQSGGDILFADGQGNKLDHEIESYDGTTGALTAWIRIPFLASTEDTTVYMYYGHASAPDQQSPQGVWDSNYVMIQHLEETSGLHQDSTGYQNHATNVSVTAQGTSGIIGGADTFDGLDDYIRMETDPSLQFGEGSFTSEVWVLPESVPGPGGARIANNRGTGSGGSYPGWQLKITDEAGGWQLWDTAIDDGGSYQMYQGTPVYSFDQWYHIAMVYEADAQLRLYVNGVQEGSIDTGTRDSITNSLPTAIGAALAADGVEDTHSQFFDGQMDEIRLSDIARSTSWLSISYRNQNDPSSFYSIGPEGESIPTAVTLASFTAEPGAEVITLTWETTIEINNVGFNLYRSDAADGPYTPLNETLIPSQAPGSMQGATYTWRDEAVIPGHTYFYQLEDIDVNGTHTYHGPISAIPGTDPNAVGLRSLGAFSSISLSTLGLIAVAIGLKAVRRKR